MKITNAINIVCSDKTSSEYMVVNNCGYYYSIDIDVKNHRPNGRADFQLIYLKEGKGEYIINGQNYCISKGDVLLYKPFEEQTYTVFSDCNSEMYWIHFTGTGIPKLLKSTGIWLKRCINIESSTLFHENIVKIIQQMQMKQNGYELFCNAYLTEIIAELARYCLQTNGTQAPKKYEKLIPALNIINSRLNDMSSVDDYASMCYIDRYYFIRLFREYTGVSPIQYRKNIKMNAALCLLSDTSLNICEISRILGYNDQLYFSRIFKKNIGVSPYEYRKSLVECGE